MRRILSFVLFSSVFVSSALAEGPYRIAVVLPLTGPNASLGSYVQKSAQLAAEDEKGKISVTFEDDQLDSKKLLAVYQKLKDQTDAFVVVGSGEGNVIAPVAERDRKIVIAVGASDAKVVEGRKYVFIHWVRPSQEADALLAGAKRRNYSSIGLVTTDQEGAIALADALKSAIQKAGMSDKFIFEEQVLPTERDFHTIAAKIRVKKVDAVATILFPGALSTFAKMMRQENSKTALVGIELFEDANEVKASDGALVGQWYVTGSEGTETFRKSYRAKYGEEAGWATPNTYDSIKLLAKFGGSKDGNEGVRAGLHDLKDFEGACGKYSASGDNRFLLPAQEKIVTKDGFEPVK